MALTSSRMNYLFRSEDKFELTSTDFLTDVSRLGRLDPFRDELFCTKRRQIQATIDAYRSSDQRLEIGSLETFFYIVTNRRLLDKMESEINIPDVAPVNNLIPNILERG